MIGKTIKEGLGTADFSQYLVQLLEIEGLFWLLNQI